MSRNRRWLVLGTGALLAAAILVIGGCATEAPVKPAGLGQKIENARTRADHEELAAFYEQEAKQAAAKSEDHRQRAENYRKTPGFGPGRDFARHCDYIADKYKETASESQTIAKMHRDLAAGAKQ